MQTNIISVKYEDKFQPKVFSGKSYSYYSNIDLEVGDIVIAPTVAGDKIARVSEVDIPEKSVENIKPFLKLISIKIDKNEYIENGKVLKEVA